MSSLCEEKKRKGKGGGDEEKKKKKRGGKFFLYSRRSRRGLALRTGAARGRPRSSVRKKERFSHFFLGKKKGVYREKVEGELFFFL